MTSTVVVGSSRIDVHIESGPMQLSNEELMQWVRMAADSVSTYYERFPVPEVALRIIPADGRGVRGGKTFGAKEGGRISIHVGRETTVNGLNSDWMLTHEMVHLAFPSMADEHHWIEEGIATYVEPIARVRAKHMDAHEMWFELVRDLHQGLPQPVTKASTTRTPGVERTGAARSSASSRTLKFTSRRITAKASTTRCAES